MSPGECPRPDPGPPEPIRLCSLAEVAQVTEALDGALTAAGYPEGDRFAVRLAAEEAVVNAVRHGHGGDPGKVVRVRFRVGRRQVLVSVEDQGLGFDPGQVPDPLSPEGLGRSSGRGLLLIRSYASRVRHNARGNRITFCRRRSAAPAKGRGPAPAEEIMLAETASVRLATRDTPGGDEQSVRHGPVSCRGGPPPAPDYAAFVLEQEAAYCQR